MGAILTIQQSKNCGPEQTRFPSHSLVLTALLIYDLNNFRVMPCHLLNSRVHRHVVEVAWEKRGHCSGGVVGTVHSHMDPRQILLQLFPILYFLGVLLLQCP